MKSTLMQRILIVSMMWSVSTIAFAVPVTTIYNAGPYAPFGHASSGLYDLTDNYVAGSGNGTATLNPAVPTDQLNPTANFTTILTTAFTAVNGWTFVNSANELTNNSLEVRTYDVQGTTGRVGADFYVTYNAGVGDPTAATHDIHWIQIVTDNHNLTNNPGHGNAENVVDNPFSPAGRSPYYDDGGAADDNEFFDFPGRLDTKNNHNWRAELFLATTPKGTGFAAQAVTLWSGVRWGWDNVWVDLPEPGTATICLLALLCTLARTNRRQPVV
jgi:hypothetical protein